MSESLYMMSKKMEIASCHHLELDYESKCTQYHGHNYIVTIHCVATTLNESGMVVDFAHVKQTIGKRYDHKCLNDVMDKNPTAENMAEEIHDIVCSMISDDCGYCYRVDVQESEGNVASFIDGRFMRTMMGDVLCK